MNVRHLFARALAEERERGEVYLANHSLGRPLDSTEANVTRGLDLWYAEMDGAWESGGWMEESKRHRTLTAGLLGLPNYDCVVPKTSAAQGLRAVLNSFPQHRPVQVVTTTEEFDSVDFVLRAYDHLGRAQVSWVSPTCEKSKSTIPMLSASAIAETVTDETDLVVVSLVFFMTGQVLQGVESLVSKAHGHGALVLLDVYHAAGVLPLDLMELDADFAIGGSYKYLRGGPGACWLAVHPRVVASGRRTLDTGWFAKKGLFGYERRDAPEWADGGDGWLESTPPVLTPYQAVPGLQFTIDTGIEELRADSLDKNLALREALRRKGIELFEPFDPSQFGAFSLLQRDDAPAVAGRLGENGLKVDARGRFVRFCPDCVTLPEEIEEAAERSARALSAY